MAYGNELGRGATMSSPKTTSWVSHVVVIALAVPLGIALIEVLVLLAPVVLDAVPPGWIGALLWGLIFRGIACLLEVLLVLIRVL